MLKQPLQGRLMAVILVSCGLGICAQAAEPLCWERTPNRPAPAQFDTFHGESLDFRCTFRGFGSLPFSGVSGGLSVSGALPPRLYYQTNGMGAAWWSLPATVASNTVSATFPPSADPGAERLTVFFGAPSNAYAAAQVRFRDSPGAQPNNLDPPSVLDWMAELSAASNSLMSSLTSATNALAKSFAPTISNTVTKAYVESLGIESGVSASTATNIAFAVSADATNSLAKSLAPTITNLAPTRAEVEAGWWSGWTVLRNGDDVTSQVRQPVWEPDEDEYGDEIWGVDVLPSDGEHGAGVIDSGVGRDATAMHWGSESGAQYTATRHRVAAPVPTKTSDLTNDSGFLTQHQQLTPVYSQTPTFGEWVCQPDIVTVYWDDYQEMWATSPSESTPQSAEAYNPNATNIEFALEAGGGYVTATRVRTDIVGYTLGSNTNDVLAAASITNTLLKSLAPTITNIASTVSSNAIANADTTYRRTIGLTNLNQSVQYVNITDPAPTTLAIQLPDGVGESSSQPTADWIVYITAVTNVALQLPPVTWWMADSSATNDIPPATPTALWFSQVTDGIFILGRQELTEVTAP